MTFALKLFFYLGPLTGIPLGVPVPALDSMMNDVASSNGLSTGSTSQHQAVAKIDGTNNFYQFLISKFYFFKTYFFDFFF